LRGSAVAPFEAFAPHGQLALTPFMMSADRVKTPNEIKAEDQATIQSRS